jgi:hypothetical protein
MLFGPKKRKIADLDVDEVMQAIAPLIGGETVDPKKYVVPAQPGISEQFPGSGRPTAPTAIAAQPETAVSFAPRIPSDEPVNMGYGRTMENDPPGVPQVARPSTAMPQAQTDTPVTFAPRRTPQQDLDEERAKNRELHSVGAPKEHSLAKRLLQGALGGFARGGIGGAITGAAVEGFYPKANTNLRTQSEIAKSDKRIGGLEKSVESESERLLREAQTQGIKDKPTLAREAAAAKAQAATDAYNRRMDYLDKQQEFEGNKWKRYTDKDGKVFKQYADGRLEPVMFNNEQDFDPGEQMVTDPLTGNPVKAKQIISPQAMIASSDAGREQDVAKFNASNQFKADTENINNSVQYHASISKMLADAAAADPGINDGEFQGLNEQIAGKHTEYDSVANQDFSGIRDPDELAKARKKQFDDLNKIAEESTALRTKALTVMSKTAAGKARADAIRKNMPPPPKKLTYTPIKAVKAGGKIARSADVDAFAKSKGWSREKTEKYLTSAAGGGYTIQ